MHQKKIGFAMTNDTYCRPMDDMLHSGNNSVGLSDAMREIAGERLIILSTFPETRRCVAE